MITPSQHASRVARRAAAPAGGLFTAGEFNFTDPPTLASGVTQVTNTVTMPHGGVLAITCQGDGSSGGEVFGAIYKNGVAQPAYTTSANTSTGAWAYSADYSTFAVATGDQVYFSYTGGGSPFHSFLQIDIYNNNYLSGTMIDRHTVQQGGCLLTTAVVAHMGGLDNGPELTAMRMLREHYRSTQGYAEEIQDYYTYSPLIVNAINNSPDKDVVYLEIYASVKSCESFVMTGQWEQAHDQYMTMYLELKNRFVI